MSQENVQNRCKKCQLITSFCKCPMAATVSCMLCTRSFTETQMLVHERKCGNLRESCEFCGTKYFIRDFTVHRRICGRYKEYASDRLFYQQALNNWADEVTGGYFLAGRIPPQLAVDLLLGHVSQVLEQIDENDRRQKVWRAELSRILNRTAFARNDRLLSGNISPTGRRLGTSKNSTSFAASPACNSLAIVPYVPPAPPLPPTPRMQICTPKESPTQTREKCVSPVQVKFKKSTILHNTVTNMSLGKSANSPKALLSTTSPTANILSNTEIPSAQIIPTVLNQIASSINILASIFRSASFPSAPREVLPSPRSSLVSSLFPLQPAKFSNTKADAVHSKLAGIRTVASTGVKTCETSPKIEVTSQTKRNHLNSQTIPSVTAVAQSRWRPALISAETQQKAASNLKLYPSLVSQEGNTPPKASSIAGVSKSSSNWSFQTAHSSPAMTFLSDAHSSLSLAQPSESIPGPAQRLTLPSDLPYTVAPSAVPVRTPLAQGEVRASLAHHEPVDSLHSVKDSPKLSTPTVSFKKCEKPDFGNKKNMK